MLCTLATIQLTYMYFSPELFLALNVLTFLVGLHTALTYAVQVEIWENGSVRSKKLFQASFIALVIIVVAALIGQLPLGMALGGLAYLLYRFSDRLTFNAMIWRGRVGWAYLISITAILIELAIFSALLDQLPETFARFVIPSVLAAILPVAVFSAICSRTLPQSSPHATASHRSDLAFAAHSLAILCVVMIDRIAPILRPALDYVDSRYLLLFSYSGALYSIGVAVLEPLRPRFFRIAKDVDTFFDFLVATRSIIITIPIAGMATIGVLLCLGLSTAHGFADPADFSPVARDAFILGGLLSFFALFLFLAYLQMFFLSRREFRAIFVSWAVAFSFRLIALTLPRLDYFLAFSTLSAGGAIVLLLFSGRKQRRNE